MFSNLSSFLPSALQQQFTTSPEKNLPPVSAHDYENREESLEEDVKPNSKRDKRNPNETFIFVRPPPAKNNHPLNLQVQLVPPNTKTPAGVVPKTSEELDGPPPPIHVSGDNNLARVSSGRSDYSGYGSTASFTSFTSTASSSSGRRMIIPLYSLQAHNVLTNVIVDAGTDAKIAKFSKRGIEMVDLAFLEPTEVWAGATKDNLIPAIRTSLEGSSAPTSKRNSLMISVSRPGTPDKSPLAPSRELAPELTAPPSPSPQKRNFFNKLFNKKPKDLDLSPTPTPTTPDTTPRKRVPTLVASPTLLASEPPQSPSLALRPPVLGIQPSLSAPTPIPIGRPSLYVWHVRRWFKGGDMSILGKLSSLAPANGSGTPTVDVRFEWKRGKSKKKSPKRIQPKRMGSRDTSVSRGTTPTASTTSLHDAAAPKAPHTGLTVDDKKKFNRLSAVSHQSNTTSGEVEDDGDESDPEDSETPWTCTLKVRRDDQSLRLKVATLSPTPHHPKVVAMLKAPFPLPDVEIDRVIARKREVAPNGAVIRSSPESGLELTAEEIKDIVSCTGMWVVVRESFGGIGKVSRKGDGWRIRA